MLRQDDILYEFSTSLAKCIVCNKLFNTDDKPISKASQLRKVLTALWEVRAQWRRLAGEIERITEGDCEVNFLDILKLVAFIKLIYNIRELFYIQAIKCNHLSTEDCFAALIHKCLRIHKDSALQVLLQALRSKAIGRDEIADEFEKALY